MSPLQGFGLICQTFSSVVLSKTIGCPASRVSRSMAKPYYTELHREKKFPTLWFSMVLCGSRWNIRVSGSSSSSSNCLNL